MNRYFLMLNTLILSILLGSVFSISALINHDQEEVMVSGHQNLVKVVDLTLDHFKCRAMPWFKDFLYSKRPYKNLVEEFVQSVDVFDTSITTELQHQVVRRTVTEQSKITRMAESIVKDIKGMMYDMANTLRGLVGKKEAFAFMLAINKAKVAMDAKLVKVESHLRQFKKACDDLKEYELSRSITHLEQTIINFKRENNNAAAALYKRTQSPGFFQ